MCAVSNMCRSVDMHCPTSCTGYAPFRGVSRSFVPKFVPKYRVRPSRFEGVRCAPRPLQVTLRNVSGAGDDSIHATADAIAESLAKTHYGDIVTARRGIRIVALDEDGRVVSYTPDGRGDRHRVGIARGARLR